MSRINHLFVHDETSSGELERVVEKHEKDISYIKIGSMIHHRVDIERVADIVRGTDIPLCIGGGVAESIAAKKRKKLFSRASEDRNHNLANLSRKGITAIEVPVSLLSNKDVIGYVRDYFEKKVVEVGKKTHCSSPKNAPSVMQEGIEQAQQFEADHIVLEGSLYGNCGIYHPDKTPNIMAVYSLMEQFEDRTRCIIEAPSQEAQDIWRSVFGSQAHIGNIENFAQMSTPSQLDLPENYGKKLGDFVNRVRDLAYEEGISWDDIARDDVLNLVLVKNIEGLSDLTDSDLQKYIRYVSNISRSTRGIARIFDIIGDMLS